MKGVDNMSGKGPFEEYLGDGLYADFDGYQIILAANDRVCGRPTDKVALEPGVISAFNRYIKGLREKGCNI
jgi:hypothetical protein